MSMIDDRVLLALCIIAQPPKVALRFTTAPELSAPFRNRPDFNSAKKARAAPNFIPGDLLLGCVKINGPTGF